MGTQGGFVRAGQFRRGVVPRCPDVFADPAPLLDAIAGAVLDAEERAGRTDPYRHVAALLHLVAGPGPGMISLRGFVAVIS